MTRARSRSKKAYWRILSADHRTMLGFVSAKGEDGALAAASKLWGPDAEGACAHPVPKRDVSAYHRALVYERESLRKATRRLGKAISALEKIL